MRKRGRQRRERGAPLCGDGIDNDGDGLVDGADNGCSGSGDNNEGDGNAVVVPNLECVYDNANGSFTAYFGYSNTSGSAVQVGNDTAKGTVNSLGSPDLDRLLPAVFAPGRQRGAVAVPFDGGTLTWTVKTAGNAAASVSASSASPSCKPIEPLVECADQSSDGTGVVRFGYVNGNNFDVRIPVGALNGFVPGAVDRAQPDQFFSGTVKGVFSVPFAPGLTWVVTGRSASVSAATARCLACTETPVETIKGNLDEVALKLGDLAKASADFLASNAKKKLSPARAAAIGLDAKRVKVKTDKLVQRARELLVTYPVVSKICPETTLCKTVDRGPVIEALKGIYAQLRNSVKRFRAHASFNTTRATSRVDKVVAAAKTLERQGLNGLASLPRFDTKCAQ